MPRSRGRRRHLPALLIIDMINAFDFKGARAMLPRALAAARAVARLKRRARAAAVPVIYVNDNFGRWRSDFRQILAHCLRSPGRRVTQLLEPDEDDYFVLKPKHSGFQSTTLDVLLEYLGAEVLILTGVAANFCVLFTAHDAYMRDYRLVVPSDCVASLTERANRLALAHMADVTKAEVCRSRELELRTL